MPVGLLGGAFDPPHNGHLGLARDAFAHFEFERLVVLPTGEPPHKEVVADAETRFRLAVAAFGELPNVELSRRELDVAGPSYTLETARWAGERYADPVFLVGADEFADFLSWREPDAVLDHVRLGVASRPGFPTERLDAVLQGLRRPDRVELFAIEPIAIASRDVRARVAANEAIGSLVPPAVAALIEELDLYR